MKYLFTVIFCVALLTNCFGQVSLPTVIPPSPQSQAFQRYGEIPVNYNIGIPDISIPLYTIKSGDVEIPVVLRYYASGIKPNDPDLSSVGSGWTLDYGGQVNRTIEGKADELFKKPDLTRNIFAINQDNVNDVYYLDSLLEPSYGADPRYDRFAYGVGDNRGSFAIQDDGSGNFTAYPYPFVPYQINVHTASPTSSQYYRSISGIDITNDHGIKYQFGYNNVETSAYGVVHANTGWYLEKVSNPSGNNQVNFSYVSGPSVSSGVNESAVQINEGTGTGPVLGSPGDNGIPLNGSPCGILQFGAPTGQNVVNYNSITYGIRNISAIAFNNGRLQFNWDSANQHLQSIVIYNTQNQVIKTIGFNISNFTNSTIHYKLNSINISGSDGSAVEKYVFSYDETNPVADNACLVDQWGYCRGSSPNTTVSISRSINVTHSQTISPGNPYNITVGDQPFTPSAAYMTRFVLNKIQYPTGGTTQFVYEPNQYNDVTTQTGGGLRIKQLTNDDGIGHATTKTYDYQPGFLEYPLSNPLYYTQCGFQISPLAECQVDEFNTPLYYVFRTRTLVNGWNSDLGPNTVFYQNVTEYNGDETNNTGKTNYTYTYDNPNIASITTVGDGTKGVFMPNYYIQTYKNWGNGLLKTKTVYKNTGSGNYQPVEDLTNNYNFTNIKTLTGIYTYIVATYQGYGNDLISIYGARNDLASRMPSKSVLLHGASVNQQNIITGAYYLASTVEDKYDGATALTINTSYAYNNPAHYYPTQIITDRSNGEKTVQDLAYVNEFSASAPYNLMQNLNVVAPVIETKNYIRNTVNADRFTSALKTNYAQWNGISEFLPQSVSTGVVENTYDPRITCNNYDSYDNITDVSKVAGPRITYLWAYNKQYPVAQATNAAFNQIAYSSCEEKFTDVEDENINGTNISFYTDNSAFFSNDSHAGLSSFYLTDGTGHEISTVLTLPVGAYVFSYWSKGSGTGNGTTVSIDDSFPVLQRVDKNADSRGWEYHELTVNIPTADYFTIYPNASGNPVLIDDIRIFPVGAQMSTYTYNPLVGMTSVTDAKNETTYYEYDSLQRLMNVKDKDGNVIRHTDYHYQGQ